MHLTFLGTSSGTPTKQRNVTALVLQGAKQRRWYLIDCGEATQHQLIKSGFSLRTLEAIFITHVHGDHCYGLPGLLASATLQGRTEPLLLVVPVAIQVWIQATMTLSQSGLGYELRFVPWEMLAGEVDTPDFKVNTIPLSHRVPSRAFKFTERATEAVIKLDQDKLHDKGIKPGQVWGQLQRGELVTLATGEQLNPLDYQLVIPAQPPRAVIIGGDNDTPELLAPYLEYVQLVVHEATYTQAVSDKVGSMPQHTSAKKIAEFAEQHDIRNLILTHFSARYSDDVSPIADEAKLYYHGTLFLAYDLAKYYLDSVGEVYPLSATE